MMTFGLPRYAVMPLAIAACLFVIEATYPKGLRAAIVDLSEYSKHDLDITQCKDRDEKLTARQTEIDNRIAQKDAILNELLAKQITFREAVVRFHHLNATDETTMDLIRTHYRGHSDEECQVLNVLSYIKSHCNGSPQGKEQYLAFERESACMIHSNISGR